MPDTNLYMHSSKLPVEVGIHGPQKLTQQVLREDLLDLNFVLLAPHHGNAWVVIVGLAGAQCNLLGLVLLAELL